MTLLKSFLLLLSFSFSTIGLAGTSSTPSFPPAGKTPKDFIPPGWTLLKKAVGDLNRDGLPDLALALASPDGNDGKSADVARWLVLIFQKADGSYEVSAKKDCVILPRDAGGVFGDPFESLLIDNGSVVLKMYGGSSERWSFTSRYRYQNGDWFLIGKTTLLNNVFEPKKFTQEDTNYLSGTVHKDTANSDGKISRQIEKLATRQLKRLADEKCE